MLFMQMIDMLQNDLVYAVDWFRAKIEKTQNQAVKINQQQAVDSFNKFMGGTPIVFDDINENLLSEWVSWLFYKGYSHGTVLTYIGRLSALYGKAVKDGVAVDNSCFSSIKKKLNSASPASLDINSGSDCFKKLRQLVLKDCSKSATCQLAKDIMLFSIYNGGLTFEKLAKYKKDDYQGNDKAVVEIVERYSKPKNKYLFPLKQSEKTPNQLNQTISSLFMKALKMVNINLSEYTATTTIDLWAVVAMHCGISATDIVSCIGDVNGVNPFFSFAVKKEIPPERKTEIRSRITQSLTKNPEYWYAMQFRPRVNYDMVNNRLKAAGIFFKKSFYPMEEIVCRIGKKMKRELKPVMPGLLFFKSKATELPEIFFQIGDIAWGYRYTRCISSPYAVITQDAIDRYQKAVGKFVDGMDSFPDGNIQIEPGDKVEITGGNFIGYPAIFEKEIRDIQKDSHTVKRITYRLRLNGYNNISWVADIDSRLVTKISDEKFDTLQEKLADVEV